MNIITNTNWLLDLVLIRFIHSVVSCSDIKENGPFWPAQYIILLTYNVEIDFCSSCDILTIDYERH